MREVSCSVTSNWQHRETQNSTSLSRAASWEPEENHDVSCLFRANVKTVRQKRLTLSPVEPALCVACSLNRRSIRTQRKRSGPSVATSWVRMGSRRCSAT